MTVRRFVTWNVWDLYRADTTAEKDRQNRLYQAVREVIRPDVWAVQELIAPAAEGTDAIKRLADATGLVPGPVARGHQIAPHDLYYWVGLLWTPDIDIVSGSERTYDGELWHNLVTCTLIVDDARIKVGSYHAGPFGRYARADEAERVVSAFTRPRPALPALCGSDSNGLAADRIETADGSWHLHDPSHPYNPPGAEWSGDLVYQTRWKYDEDTGRREWWEDREAGDVLWSGGLHSVRALLGAAPAPTAGHVETGAFGWREIDHVRANDAMRPAISSIDTPTTVDDCSDHRPVIAEFIPARLG
jgi:endonuclease/exonuclease/phosphatase family metal-dependent hydrolase